MSQAFTHLNEALEGRYTIERELGEGGMANVYLADDVRHERKVALKVLKPELAAVVGPERFLSEIKTTANLQHPHILPLFDSGEAGGFLFYVMPYFEGESLRERLDRERQLPIEDAVKIARNVAEALDYAHSSGVLHRDIKPANILLQAGKPVVADFGIALAVGAAGGGRLTETGMSLGTPHYMSPEQATGEDNVGPATDIYALGCVLYEMLVGAPPFTGSSVQAVLGQIIAGEIPSALDQRGTVPPNVDAVIRRSLEKLPADRFSGAGGFAHALTVPGFRHGADLTQTRRRAVGPLVLAGAIGAAAAFAAAWALFGGGGGRSGVEFGDLRKLTSDPGLEILPAISPNGQEVAYVTSPAFTGPGRIVVRSLGGGTATPVADEAVGNERYPQWSPDGLELLFDARPRPFRAPARGGSARPIVPADEGGASLFATWSPDGTEVAYIRSQDEHAGIYVRGLTSGEERLVTPLPTCTSPSICFTHSLVWSRDGRWIAFVEGNWQWVTLGGVFGNVAPTAIHLVSADGGEPIDVTGAETLNVSPAFLPDGRLMFISGRGGGRDLYVLELEGDGTPAAEPERLTAGLNPHHVALSADASTMAIGTLSRRQNIYALEVPTSGTASAYAGRPITFGAQVIEGMAISPDGESIAYDSDLAGAQNVYRMPLAGGQPLRLTDHPTNLFVRTWAGDDIMGHGFNGAVRDVYSVDPEGLGFEFIAPSSGHDHYPDLSPDGQSVLFDSRRDDVWHIVRRDRIEGGGWGEALAVTPGQHARWSPSGETFASETRDAVSVTSAGTGETREVFRDSDAAIITLEWLNEETLLLYRIFPDQTSGMYTLTTSGELGREVIGFDDPARQPRLEMALHDGVLYYTLGEFEADIWVMDLSWE